MIKRIIHFVIIGLITFILLEGSIFLMVHFGGLNIILPTYNMDSPEDLLPERSHIYGHRHRPNSTYEIKKNCLHTFYEFNSLGFRDEEPSLEDSSYKVMVIGDSFMEGLGVKEEERLGDLLESRTGVPHLNFAMADKGPTQTFVIYDSIASKYPHDAVLMALFPINDLIDDDPTVGKNSNSIRPCWLGNYPNYQLKFVPDSAPSHKEYQWWKHFLKTHTYTYDALFYLKESIKAKMGSRAAYPKTDYFTYSKEQLDRMKFSLLKLKEKVNNKPLIVLCIPSNRSFIEGSDPNKSFIEHPLSSFCAANNIEFIGLYDALSKRAEHPESAFYFSCDSHWQAQGHQAAAEIVLEQSVFYQNLVSK